MEASRASDHTTVTESVKFDFRLIKLQFDFRLIGLKFDFRLIEGG